MSSVHPLRQAYIQAVYRQYGQRVRGDKNPTFTEQAAMKISRLGLDYRTYMDAAMKLCAGWMEYRHWKYPYYNAVIGDQTIAKVKSLLEYTTLDDGGEEVDLFEYELLYATQYIEWWFGDGDRPRRNGVDVPMKIRDSVAQYLCNTYGVPFTSSNYNDVCRALEKAHG